jgi:hypothetical protein
MLDDIWLRQHFTYISHIILVGNNISISLKKPLVLLYSSSDSAMTLGIMTFSIMTLSIMTLSIMTLSIMILSIMILSIKQSA